MYPWLLGQHNLYNQRGGTALEPPFTEVNKFLRFWNEDGRKIKEKIKNSNLQVRGNCGMASSQN